jgi:hypothetical protein
VLAAARAARAIRVFFIANFSKVKKGPRSDGCRSPFKTLSQPPIQEVVCIPPDVNDFAKTFEKDRGFLLLACNKAWYLPSDHGRLDALSPINSMTSVNY